MGRHDDALVCLPSVHDRPAGGPPTLLQLFAAPHSLLIRLSCLHSQTSCDPNCHSNPIAHASASGFLLISLSTTPRISIFPTRSVLPEAFPIKARDQ